MPPANSILRRNRNAGAIAYVDVIVKPGSKQPGIAVEADAVVVRVRERAVDGSANAACIASLAARLGVAPSSVNLLRGARGRRKLFGIAGISTAQAFARLAGE